MENPLRVLYVLVKYRSTPNVVLKARFMNILGFMLAWYLRLRLLYCYVCIGYFWTLLYTNENVQNISASEKVRKW